MPVQYREKGCAQDIDNLMATIAALNDWGFGHPVLEKVGRFQELSKRGHPSHGADGHVRVITDMEDPAAGLDRECVVSTSTYSGKLITLRVTNVVTWRSWQHAAI